MSIHDLGPRTEEDYPPAKPTRWGDDYGPCTLADRARPYIDDYPAHRSGWQAGSRWGSRPAREFGRDEDRGWAAVKGRFALGWLRIRNTFRVSAGAAT